MQSGGERRAGLTSIDVPISLVGGGGRGGEDGGDGGEGGRVHCSRGGRAACGGGAHQIRETADRTARRARTGKRKPRGREFQPRARPPLSLHPIPYTLYRLP